jgi:hypothetical protein
MPPNTKSKMNVKNMNGGYTDGTARPEPVGICSNQTIREGESFT